MKKIAVFTPENWFLDLWLEVAKYHEVLFNRCDKDCEYIIGASISQMDSVINAARQFPHIPIINYCWDLYSYSVNETREGELNYRLYAKLLKESKEVWVPSQSTANVLRNWINKEGRVIKTFVPIFDHPVSDNRFVLNPLRKLPDKQLGWVEKACNELGIPCFSPDHKLSFGEYKKLVAGATVIASGYLEASTGGLTLIEGLYLGKYCLACASPFQGASEYMQNHGFYFADYNDLKFMLKLLWNNPPPFDELAAAKFVLKEYSVERMALDVMSRL